VARFEAKVVNRERDEAMRDYRIAPKFLSLFARGSQAYAQFRHFREQ
jgi:hypothetical protein